MLKFCETNAYIAPGKTTVMLFNYLADVYGQKFISWHINEVPICE